MSTTKKIVCNYPEFVEQITKITEDTFFKIEGDFIPMSEQQIKNLNVSQERLEKYYEYNNEWPASYGLVEIGLLLSSVKEGVKVELDLSEFENFGFESFSYDNINSLKGIILPDSLSILSVDSFWDCKNLEYVIIPKGLCSTINEYAFDICPKLKYIKVEKELDIVENWAVIGCDSLQTVEYPKRDANYYYLNPTAFNPEDICIETSRLILKPLIKKHYEKAINYYLDPRVTKYEEKSEHIDKDQVKKELKRSEDYWNDHDFKLCHFAIFLKENGENIGHIPLSHPSSRMEQVEELKDQTGYTIGWGLTYEYQKKGYATEAAKAIVEWAKAFLKIKRLWAFADKENNASIHVMEKLGMSFVKEFKYLSNKDQERFRVVYAVEKME